MPKKHKSCFLDAGCAHAVWKPRCGSVVECVTRKNDIQKRQHKLLSRVWATQQVLKVHRKQSETAIIVDDKEVDGTDQSISEERKMWQNVITKVMEDNKKGKYSRKSIHFHNVVTQYVAAMSEADHCDAAAQCAHVLTKATSSPQLRNRSIKQKKTALKPFFSQTDFQGVLEKRDENHETQH